MKANRDRVFYDRNKSRTNHGNKKKKATTMLDQAN
jgi:hypothetical protein